MQKTVLRNAKRLLVILYLVAIVPIIAYFGKDIGETVFDKVYSTSDEIYHHYGSWGVLVHHDEWEILQILKGEDQIQIIDTEPFVTGIVTINEDNREQILDDFLNVRICKLTLECIAVLLVMGLAFIGMSYRGFYIPAWGIVLGIETFFAEEAAYLIVEFVLSFIVKSAVSFPLSYELAWGSIVGVLLFVLLNAANWIQTKSGFKFKFMFLKMTGCLVAGHCISLFCVFYPLRYTEDALALTVLIPVFFISLLLALVLRMVQLWIQRIKTLLKRSNRRI